MYSYPLVNTLSKGIKSLRKNHSADINSILFVLETVCLQNPSWLVATSAFVSYRQNADGKTNRLISLHPANIL